MEAEQSPRGTADLEELLGADQRPLAATDTANTPIGGGQAAGDGGSPAEVEQRVEVLREEFLGSLHRSADAASDEGGGATAAAAPDGGEPATQLQATEDVDEESEVDFEEEVDDEFEDAAEVEDAEREAAEAAAEGSTAAQQAAPSGSAPAAWEGPSTSRAALQLHPLEALDEEPDPLSDAIDAVLAAHEAKASTSGTAGGKGRSGGAASLLSGLLSRVHGGVQAGKQLVGQHIKMGERSGVGGAERNRRMQQTAQAPRREKKTSVRCVLGGAVFCGMWWHSNAWQYSPRVAVWSPMGCAVLLALLLSAWLRAAASGLQANKRTMLSHGAASAALPPQSCPSLATCATWAGQRCSPSRLPAFARFAAVA